MNRIGNLVVPNSNYCAFEDWVVPILDQMLLEQEASKNTQEPLVWAPSTIIHRLGKEINNDASICYWAYKNQIPVFCPALTDGSLGDMLYFHTFKSSPQILDISITRDIRKINDIAMNAKRAGMIILGGGLVKHHIANACLMRNGAESAVYINTAQEFDGSDAGARPDEAVSWGKIKVDGDSVKVCFGRNIHSLTVKLIFQGLRRGHSGVSPYRGGNLCQIPDGQPGVILIQPNLPRGWTLKIYARHLKLMDSQRSPGIQFMPIGLGYSTPMLILKKAAMFLPLEKA